MTQAIYAISYVLDAQGGVIVRSKAGNLSYAYPTSPSAHRIGRDCGKQDARHVAIMMATSADMDAGWVPAEIVARHNSHLAECYNAAIAGGATVHAISAVEG